MEIIISEAKRKEMDVNKNNFLEEIHKLRQANLKLWFENYKLQESQKKMLIELSDAREKVVQCEQEVQKMKKEIKNSQWTTIFKRETPRICFSLLSILFN